MNVLARINARKIVLSVIYQQCFFLKLKKQDKITSEILFLDNVFESNKEEFQEEKKVFIELLDTYSDEPLDDRVDYLLRHCFDKWDMENIDMDYIRTILRSYDKYIDEIPAIVDKYTKTFSYDEMSLMTQSIFIL